MFVLYALKFIKHFYCIINVVFIDAMQDLSRVLQLTEGKKTRARAQAYCQRGVLLRKLGDDDSARSNFQEAAKLGSSFAKKQVYLYIIWCNP